MADVSVTVGGRTHLLACRTGEEAHVVALGRTLDALAPAAARGAGTAGAERMMLLIAMMLADTIEDMKAGDPAEPAAAVPESDKAAAGVAQDAVLASVADRLERIATALEHGGTSA